jgi:hypothetical protein
MLTTNEKCEYGEVFVYSSLFTGQFSYWLATANYIQNEKAKISRLTTGLMATFDPLNDLEFPAY